MELSAVDVITFHCPCCYAGLSVPNSLAGVVGPCPSCGESIAAPHMEEVPYAFPDLAETVLVPKSSGMQLPPPDGAHEPALRPIAPIHPRVSLAESLRRQTEPVDAPLLADRFTARLAIPPSEQPPDDRWRGRALQKQRWNRRLRKADKAAETMMSSRGFQWARVALLVVTGGMAAGLYLYLKENDFTFMPKSSQALPVAAQEAASSPAGAVMPAMIPQQGIALENPADAESPFADPLTTTPTAPAALNASGSGASPQIK